jgi:hypothetical protein
MQEILILAHIQEKFKHIYIIRAYNTFFERQILFGKTRL